MFSQDFIDITEKSIENFKRRPIIDFIEEKKVAGFVHRLNIIIGTISGSFSIAF